jgi:hypothetical protein
MMIGKHLVLVPVELQRVDQNIRESFRDLKVYVTRTCPYLVLFNCTTSSKSTLERQCLEKGALD